MTFSGTDDAVNLRGRYEGMNVGILMQFSPEEVKNTVCFICFPALIL